MPDLDLDPKDYRAQPLQGERVFLSGGLSRLVIIVSVIAGLVLANIYVRPHFIEWFHWLTGRS